MAWQPNLPYTTLAMLQNPIGETLVKGVKQKQYGEGERVFVSFRTFGGTEKHQTDKLLLKIQRQSKRGIVRTLLRRAVSRLTGQHMRY